MAHRYRMYPTAAQARFMLERHCSDARFVWNLAVEQFSYGVRGRRGPGPAARQKQLAQARHAFDWLAGGSSSVQQQALRDFDRAVGAYFTGTHRRPSWRRKHLDEGFCVRDSRVQGVNRKWAQVLVPKLGLVKFRLSRPLPPGKLGMARVTCKAGRWHVAFPAPQPAVSARPGRADRQVGIDRGVKTTLALSDGIMLRAPIMRRREQHKLARLQRQLSRCRKGSGRRGKVKARIARLHAGVADRRRDWIEKTTTRIAGSYGVVAVEKLVIGNMVRTPQPKPDPEVPGHYLPNGKAAKAGLNRGIYANCWGLIAQRLDHKTSASGTTVVEVSAAYSSLQCRQCGHTASGNRKSQAEFQCVKCGHHDHADIQAANTILARATRLALTSGPEATPEPSGVLAQARRPEAAHAA
ncbi:transposase [Mycobacteroides abscessus subsp. massiliense]|uniref:RNA-guided endonuclease InsQ/TnpB family protein n=1 Tax=Mycobacteroides abscessus TaxID=36809 RepID=UPI0009A8CB1B|nr:RNA-guided endonuclease TnpB family protein [Mycobacteroides abscessus]SKL16210.1 transposase [Mycobacteroides abscessus subsp. massiliense]SKL94711.1 transposase [Mycobacteroides abscessus subsp. massiliense]SKM77714.1 transposase [Mycobacteroides abscessus subsp. massiliense]